MQPVQHCQRAGLCGLRHQCQLLILRLAHVQRGHGDSGFVQVDEACVVVAGRCGANLGNHGGQPGDACLLGAHGGGLALQLGALGLLLLALRFQPGGFFLAGL